ARGLLAAGGSVHRWHRARHFAPAVLALLDAGHARSGPGEDLRAVCKPVHAWHGAQPHLVSPAPGRTATVPQSCRGRAAARSEQAARWRGVAGGSSARGIRGAGDHVEVEEQRCGPAGAGGAVRCRYGAVVRHVRGPSGADAGVVGQYRFLHRLWKSVHDHVSAGVVARYGADGSGDAGRAALGDAARGLRRLTHQTLVKVTHDIGRRRTFNTAIAAVRELFNAIGHYTETDAVARAVRQEALEIAVISLSPIAPHVCHALWHELGHERPIIDEPWPQADAQALEQALVELIVQVNGKLRGR